MSSAASRQRQRKQRRAREKLWAAQKALADRVVAFESYERVIADMRARQLSPFSGAQAIAIVAVCRDAVGGECKRLQSDVAALKKAVSSDPKETMHP